MVGPDIRKKKRIIRNSRQQIQSECICSKGQRITHLVCILAWVKSTNWELICEGILQLKLLAISTNLMKQTNKKSSTQELEPYIVQEHFFKHGLVLSNTMKIIFNYSEVKMR